MICNKCGKSFTKALDLYDGALACPNCKSLLSNYSNLSINDESDEYYQLAKEAYYLYLSKESIGKGVDPKLPLLDKSIQFMEEASNMGHPFARFELAEYYINYSFNGLNVSERMKKAFEALYSICIGLDLDNFNTQYDECKALKSEAASSILNLYNEYYEIFSGNADYDKKKNIVEKEYPKIASSIKNLKVKVNRMNSIYSLLYSYINKKKAPVFGLIYLTGKEANSLYKFIPEGEKSDPCGSFIGSGLTFGYLETEKKGLPFAGNDNTRITYTKHRQAFEEAMENFNEDDHLYLYFFNTQGKHKYLNPGKLNKVFNALDKNTNAFITQLVKYNQQDEYVFYDDDVYFYLKGNNVDSAIEHLINHVCGVETYGD